MKSDQFVSAVRCAAYDSLPQFADKGRDLGLARFQLNSELRRQSPETAVAAHQAVADVARRANAATTPAALTALRIDRSAACTGGAIVADHAPADGEG
ncbi:MAG TPA: hypothetical protein VG841_07945 [Caulobacterales bacterium]|nr:hypothetical protein [Caulobacterales bacterium]